jgi:hypothetical protein
MKHTASSTGEEAYSFSRIFFKDRGFSPLTFAAATVGKPFSEEAMCHFALNDTQ